MLSADETQALAARARTAARAVVGLVLEEERAARFVHAYTFDYRRLGITGEAEHKAELLSAIERESLLLVAAYIERTLPRAAGARFSRQAEAEAVAGFRQAFLTFLGGSLAWDNDEREAFRRDLGMYLRLAAREGRGMGQRRGQAPAIGAFVDRCAFLVDPSMMAQAREAAARYQAELESCADQALRAAFRGFRPRAAATPRPARVPNRAPRRQSAPRPKSAARRKSAPKRASRAKAVPRRKPARRAKPASRRLKKRGGTSPRRKETSRRKTAPTGKSRPRRKSPPRGKSKRRPRSTPKRPRRGGGR